MSTSVTYEPHRGSAASVNPPDSVGRRSPALGWLIALRGGLGVIFGLIALFMPIATILALVLLFSAYMIVDGAFAIYAAMRPARRRESGGFLAFQGIGRVAAGVIAFVRPPALAACYRRRGARAEDFPTRQITLIAPWPAGGAVDALCRAVAQPLSERLGNPSWSRTGRVRAR